MTLESHYRIAIIGAGPGGLSAGAHAAELGISHVLLEASPEISKTIRQYQKGKHVMDEPASIPLRSALPFSSGTRESVLDGWETATRAQSTNLVPDAVVTGLEGRQGEFHITLGDGRSCVAEHVVLAIGVQGNLRKLGIEGEDLGFAQYQLDDPDEYFDENIVVIGAGDAAIENALALAPHNNVVIVNRRDEFARAKQGNLNDILRAIDSDELECVYSASPVRIARHDEGGRARAALTLDTPTGETDFVCDRIIARLGATPPRQFLEAIGIAFQTEDANAAPVLSSIYESSVPGLFIIGALAGYPLIKQCMNQGYEVIEYIEGRDIAPVDEDILWAKLRHLDGARCVDDALDLVCGTVPFLAGLTRLQVREFLLDSDVVKIDTGEVVFRQGDYTNSLYCVLDGRIGVEVGNLDHDGSNELGAGSFFGEMSLLSGRRRSATVVGRTDAVLIETPRRTMTRLINSDETVRRVIDEAFLVRAIRQFAPGVEETSLLEVAGRAALERFDVNVCLFEEGDEGDTLYLIRSGSVTVSRVLGGREITFAYVPAGHYVGEMSLLSGAPRSSTVRAAARTEVIRFDRDAFTLLLDRDPGLRQRIEATYRQRVGEEVGLLENARLGEQLTFLVNQGVGEATDVLLIDESLCIRCDQCERACAGTHGNNSRLNREAGPSFDLLHVPTSCRHCEHPHCMKECPPDAIHRAPNGEVFIDDTCIGCGNCEQNCPYGVIQMAVPQKPPTSLWRSLLFGRDERDNTPSDPHAAKKAVKCDMCKDIEGGAACVRACPTGAAIRLSPEEFFTATTV